MRKRGARVNVEDKKVKDWTRKQKTVYSGIYGLILLLEGRNCLKKRENTLEKKASKPFKTIGRKDFSMLTIMAISM